MRLQSTNYRRALLLGSALALSLSYRSPSAAAATAVEDLGPVARGTSITATLWLKARDEQALEAAVADREDPGSLRYHHWMSSSEIAGYGPSQADLSALRQSLEAAGLAVSARDGTGDALLVTGPASTVGAAFGTTLHAIRIGGRQFRATTTEPHFSGAGNAAIAGITGLTTAPMQPYVLRQMQFSTGKPVQLSLAAAASPASVFTDNCFKQKQVFTLSHFIPGGKTQAANLTGPQYVQTGSAPATATCGYTAAEISAHYGLSAVYQSGDQGQGQTIVLIDAYGSPTIQTDANSFSKMMGLPALDASNFSVVYPDGPPIANPYPTGWPVEISLDVEWAHAIAPKAKLVLVVAPSDDADELTYALNYAVTHHLGQVISNSYGYPEAGYGPATARAFNAVIRKAAAQGIAVNVSTGDSGDFGLGTPDGAASIPADSPYATGVGGTSLGVPSDNGPVETAWGTDITDIGDINGISIPPAFEGFQQGGGGGESAYLEKPRWQKALVGTGRLLPDVSAVADPFTGAIIVTPNDNGSASVVEVIGGTSLSSPVFSGIWALANQEAGISLGQAAPIISRLPAIALRDIVPIAASQSNLAGTVGLAASPTTYSAAALLDLPASEPNGFVGTGVTITSPTAGIGALFDLSFGTDSSLMAYPGWDNATGYGVPNGLAFIRAAAAAK